MEKSQSSIPDMPGADRQHSDPTPADNDANPLHEPCWPVQRGGDTSEDKKDDDQETSDTRIPGPAVGGRIGGIAPCQHEASGRQRGEGNQVMRLWMVP